MFDLQRFKIWCSTSYLFRAPCFLDKKTKHQKRSPRKKGFLFIFYFFYFLEPNGLPLFLLTTGISVSPNFSSLRFSLASFNNVFLFFEPAGLPLPLFTGSSIVVSTFGIAAAAIYFALFLNTGSINVVCVS